MITFKSNLQKFGGLISQGYLLYDKIKAQFYLNIMLPLVINVCCFSSFSRFFFYEGHVR